jgi:hypothetical protein
MKYMVRSSRNLSRRKGILMLMKRSELKPVEIYKPKI